MGANVLFWSRSQRSAQLEELIATSDIVSLHLPLTEETANIVDVRRMKRGAILVNTARGGLVDQDLLLQALKSGHLAAAGLDVFAKEPLRPDHPLLGLKNVVSTPHLAWLTGETLQRSLSIALENTDRMQKGFPLLHRVA
jgi:phosphoglycerate dehydrogenase-like enzyme